MSALWTGPAMVEAMNGRPSGTLPAEVTGISIDTRTLEPGEAFFAIKGDQFDGHDFVTAAVKAGASVLVISEGRLPGLGRLTVPLIVVEDVLEGLRRLGVAARARSKAKIIAVTGSAGKTTTKQALRHILSAAGTVHASDKSFNNHWGVPLSLARMPEDTDYGVFEIGMNHANEIRPLVKLVRPHVAIVTLIAAAHLGHFSSLDEIAHAKAEIFEGVVSGGHGLINRDDERFKLLEKLARAAGVASIHGFGAHARATYRLADSEMRADGSSITVKTPGGEVKAEIGAPGHHMILNALAALGAADLAGADLEAIAPALAEMKAGRGRGERHHLKHPKGGTVTLIDESYNANPASMRVALDLLAATPTKRRGRRIAVLGDMLELGEHSERLHSALAEDIAASETDVVFLAGPEIKATADNLPETARAEYRKDAKALKPVLLSAVRPGDVIVIKSSNGARFSQLVDALLEAFPAA